MDLRQFTTTPSNFDQDQRRTSISSMSSAQSGYSSAYGGVGNHTPSNQRYAQPHYYGQQHNSHSMQQQHHHQHQNQNQNQHHQGQQHHQNHHGQGQGQHLQGQQQLHHQVPQQQAQPQQVSNGSAQNSNWLQNSGLNVTPWIEQQAQVTNSTTSVENQNFINSYGNNLNGPIQGSNNNNNYLAQQQQAQLQQQQPFVQQQHQHLGMTQSMQASFDSQSTRVSPSSSNVIPSDASMMIHKSNNVIDDHHHLHDQHDKNDNNDSINDNDDEHNHDIDDELIPTAIVIKNIPFAIKKEQLLEVMTKLNLPLPYAFNYHFDNGVFRGLAFANFTSTDETTTVVTQLNGREIGGRKLRVEYKKMLPLVERERIEREKREKRGQLEEQHRSTSNASLASMISIASAPSSTKQVGGSAPPLSSGGNVVGGIVGGTVEQPLQPQHTASERYYAPIPFVSNLPIPPSQVDFNDAETLEFYSQLLFFRDDREKLYNEIAYPATLSQGHKRIISILAQFLGLVEVFDNSLILIKRRNVIHDPSPILRSQSHSAIPLLNQPPPSSQGQRYRQQPGNLPQQAPNRIPPNFSIGNNGGLSSAALLRNNPTPTRVLPTLYNGANAGTGAQGYYPTGPNQAQAGSGAPQGQAPQQQQQQQQPPSQQQQQPPQVSQSQPGTPGLDPMSRFNLQPGQWDESYSSGNTGGSTSSQGRSGEQELNEGINSLNLGLDGGSNIWGPRSSSSIQPAV